MGDKIYSKKSKSNILEFNRDQEFYFKIAIKHAMNRNFEDALKYFDKAILLDMYNADFLFNKACVLVEVGELDESIEILNKIIWEIDPTYAECYFGLGCNYFELEEFAEALVHFEKYVTISDDGDFIEDAYEILLYMQFLDEKGDIHIDKRTVDRIRNHKGYKRSSMRLQEDGMRFLSSGNYLGAIKKFEK